MAEGLVRYEAAKRALAEVHSVDEVKDIRDKAVAMQAYAKQAKDYALIEQATEIRLRAERRAGEVLLEMEERRERETRGGDRRSKSSDVTLKLADLGVSKTESSQWQALARLDAERFEVRVAAMKKRATSRDAMTTVEKQERRAVMEAELGARQMALPMKRFGVIYADPPWRFQPHSRITGLDRAAESHYPTMTLDAIKALSVLSIAADDCALFLWSTRPHLMNAFAVVEAWGFSYRSCFGWRKLNADGSPHLGTGYWSRDNFEVLLIATRGDVPAPVQGTQWPSMIEAPVGRHSEKPAIFYDLIETYFPSLPRIELFARSARPNWDRWGAEAPIAEVEPAPGRPQAQAPRHAQGGVEGGDAATAEGSPQRGAAREGLRDSSAGCTPMLARCIAGGSWEGWDLPEPKERKMEHG
jgi:N6-adenosine-specific RNA methylase IME4